MKNLKFNNLEAKELFGDKIIISNSDGTIWTADKFETTSDHEENFKDLDLPILECKERSTRGFGFKKVNVVNLQKTKYTREHFSNSFGSGSATDPLSFHSRNIDKLK